VIPLEQETHAAMRQGQEMKLERGAERRAVRVELVCLMVCGGRLAKRFHVTLEWHRRRRSANGRSRVMAGTVRILAGAIGLSVLVVTATAAAVVPKSCPSASIVSAALGTKASTARLAKNPYGITCTYGANALAPKVDFQLDTATTFAAGEKAANAASPIAKINHLGKAAWAPKTGGFLYVFTGSYSIKILAVLTSLPKLEALARKLL